MFVDRVHKAALLKKAGAPTKQVEHPESFWFQFHLLFLFFAGRAEGEKLRLLSKARRQRIFCSKRKRWAAKASSVFQAEECRHWPRVRMAWHSRSEPMAITKNLFWSLRLGLPRPSARLRAMLAAARSNCSFRAPLRCRERAFQKLLSALCHQLTALRF
jgi:hypothetical protein